MQSAEVGMWASRIAEICGGLSSSLLEEGTRKGACILVAATAAALPAQVCFDMLNRPVIAMRLSSDDFSVRSARPLGHMATG